MKKHVYALVIIVVLALIIGSMYLFYKGTQQSQYQKFSDRFVYRGDIGEYQPKDMNDSILLMQMEVLQFKDEVRNDLTSNRLNWGDIIISIAGIFAALVTVIGLIQKFFDDKRKSDIRELQLAVSTNHVETKGFFAQTTESLTENTKQHNKIFNSLILVEDITVRRNITDKLRSIARGYLHYQKGILTQPMQTLITSQAERLIELSEQVMNESFSEEVYDMAAMRIDELSRVAREQVCELIGTDFMRSKYKEIQSRAVNNFKHSLYNISNDKVFNSKYERYTRAAETFLDELIRETIKSYNDHQKIAV